MQTALAGIEALVKQIMMILERRFSRINMEHKA